LRPLAKEGVAIIVISSDLPENLAVSDRIIAVKQGRVGGQLTSADASQERVMAAATG
jgi:ribose transport system ATP-binding protein